MKRWKFSMARSVTITALFDLLTEDLNQKKRATAIATPEGQTLYVRPIGPMDVATLPHAALLCNQYLGLAAGDVAIVNDPSSGGTRLADVTLVTAVSGFLIATRVAFPARWAGNAKLDEEGVRIPPTPLANRGALNRDLLNAIASHPNAPFDFAQTIESAVTDLLETADQLGCVASDRESELNRESLNFYLRDTSRGFETLMHRLPLGSADVSMRVPSGEMIKLRLEMTENKIQFDFKGTENSSRVAITERTTLSACMWTVLSMIDEKIAINSGLFEHFQVSAPSGTMLDQKGAVGTERGVQMLVPALCNLIVTAFAKLNPALKGADCPGGFARLLIEAGQERAILTAACGSRATSKEAGEDACALFGSQQAKAAENSNLVSWIMRGLNPKSGGDGKFKGGDGELLHFKITKPSTLRWDLSAGSAKSPGASQGKPGESAQLSIIRNGQPENEIKEREGSIELASGDEVKLFGAGGGGFGEPLTTE